MTVISAWPGRCSSAWATHKPTDKKHTPTETNVQHETKHTLRTPLWAEKEADVFSYLAAVRSHAPGEISPQSLDECCLGGGGEFVVLGITSKRLLWHGFHFAMVCQTVDLLRFSATTPAYHAVSPTVAAIFISRLCVLRDRVRALRAGAPKWRANSNLHWVTHCFSS